MTVVALWLLGQPVVWVVAVVGWYAAACRLYPFGRCPRCRGTGRIHPPAGSRKHFKECRRCRGTGRRLRIGRRVFNHLHKTRGKAQA